MSPKRSHLHHPLLRRPVFYALAFSLVYACFYLATSPRANVSYADSDLLTIIGYQLGVAHPPGYPFLILLLHFFTHLPLPFSIALKANLVSILFHSATLFVLFLAIFELLGLVISRLKLSLSFPLRLAISGLSLLPLAANYLFWLYGIIAEKYALNDFLISLTLYLLIRLKASPTSRRLWFSLALVIGLGLGHHHTYLLFLPSLIVFFWSHREHIRRHSRSMIMALLAALGFFTAGLIFLNSRQAAVSWNFAPTLEGFVRMVTRRDLSGYQVIEGKYRGIYLDPVTVPEVLEKLPLHLNLFLDYFGFPAVLVLLLGLYFLFRHRLPLKLPLLLVLIFTTVFIPLYLDWPADLSTQGIRIRMFLAGWVHLPLFFALGLVYLYRTKRFIFPAAVAFFAIFYLHQTLTSFRQANLSRFDHISRFYTQALDSLPPDTLLACISDTSCFATLYAQQILGHRPDVFILPHANNIIKNQLDAHPELKGFDYPQNPELYLDYLTWNLNRRPVYISELQQIYYRLLGINYGFFYYLPDSYQGQLATSSATYQYQPDYSFSNFLIGQSYPPKDHFRLQLKASLAQKHLLNARVLARLQQPQEHIDTELDLALRLSQDLPVIYLQDAQAARTEILAINGPDSYVPGNADPSTDQIIDQAGLYYHQGDDNSMYLGLTNLLWRYPNHLKARETLAWLYETRGFLPEARIEYQNLLKLDPQNPTALQGLSRL